jgi:serine/threonine protein kinase
LVTTRVKFPKMTIGVGSRVGPYEVTALLGEGGMGKVWRAHHTALKRDDAVKVLRMRLRRTLTASLDSGERRKSSRH